MILDRKQKKESSNKYELDFREKKCLSYIKERKYDQLKEMLKELNVDRTWKANRGEIPFHRLLVESLEVKDQMALRYVLSVIKIIQPILNDERLLTEDPTLFQQILDSGKLECSVNRTFSMVVKNGKEERVNIEGNLLEILVFMQKTELVQILLEKKYGFIEYRYQSDSFPGVFFKWNKNICGFQQNPLSLAIFLKNKKIIQMLMKQKNVERLLMTDVFLNLQGTQKEKNEFVLWFLENYYQQIMEKISLNWLIRNPNLPAGRSIWLNYYKDVYGLQIVLKEMKCWTEELENKSDFWLSDYDVAIGAVLFFYIIKKIVEKQEEKQQICCAEKQCMEVLKKSDNLLNSVQIQIQIIDYYRRTKKLDQELLGRLINIYIYYCEERKCDVSCNSTLLWSGIITAKEAKKLKQKSAKCLKKLIELPDISRTVPVIKHLNRNVNVKAILNVMDKLNPTRNRIIEKNERESSFLAFVILQDSIQLIKKAWKLGYLTTNNLAIAIEFAAKNEKRKIMPLLFEYKGVQKNQSTEYVL